MNKIDEVMKVICELCNFHDSYGDCFTCKVKDKIKEILKGDDNK